jgi:hypothetical protein
VAGPCEHGNEPSVSIKDTLSFSRRTPELFIYKLVLKTELFIFNDIRILRHGRTFHTINRFCVT